MNDTSRTAHQNSEIPPHEYDKINRLLLIFHTAAENLLNEWNKNGGRGLSEKYPFTPSFDEVVSRIQIWALAHPPEREKRINPVMQQVAINSFANVRTKAALLNRLIDNMANNINVPEKCDWGLIVSADKIADDLNEALGHIDKEGTGIAL